MTDVLTVPTHFGDISELSSGLADRVDEERLILYGPTAYEEGATVGFSVLLVDGSPALEGIGRVTAAVDGGEERAPETRFDIVFDSLQLEGMSEVVYERIVMARASMVGDEPATGEVDIGELEEAAAAEAAPEAEAHSADWEGDAETAVADPEQVAALADESAGEPDMGFDDGGATVVADVSELDDAAAAAAFDAGADAAAVDEDAGADFGAEEDDGADLAADVDMDVAADVDVAADMDVAADVDMGEVSDVDTGEVELSDAAEDSYDDSSYEDSYGEPESAPPASARDSLGPPPEDPPIAPSPELPPAPAGFQIPASEGRLVRPTFPPTWHPMASEPPAPTESTGFFLYQANDLPVPEMAPRPDMDPSLRVQPAPRPDPSAAEAGANQPAPEPRGDTGDEPPQIPLPDDDADVAPAVEPDSFALGDEAAIQEPDGEGDPADAAPEMELDADMMDESADDEPPPPPVEAMGDDDFDGEIAVDASLDGEDIAFEEDDRV